MVSRRFLEQAARRLRAAVLRPWVAVLFLMLAGSAQAGPAPVPRLSPLPGAYPGPVGVTLSADVAGAEIHFTVDGTAPTLASPRYTSPIAVEGSATIRAIAVAPGYSDSPETRGTYSTGPATRYGIAAEFTRSWTTTAAAQTVEFSTRASDVVLLAFVSSAGTPGTTESVSLTSSDLTWTSLNAEARQPTFAGIWTATAPVPLALASTRVARATSGSPMTITIVALVGARPASVGPLFTGNDSGSSGAPRGSMACEVDAWCYAVVSAAAAAGPVTLLPGQTLVSETIDAASGADLWVQQDATAGGGRTLGVTSPTSTSWNMVTVEVLPLIPEPPDFSPPAGTYDGPVTVTLIRSHAASTILYTTDGTMPTTSSTEYWSPFTISRTTTINAVSGYLPQGPLSAVATATYTIRPPPVSLAVQAPSTTLVSSGTVQCTATGTYSDGSTRDLTSGVTWASSNAAVASVSASGLVTAGAAAGSATITATIGAITGSVAVSVKLGGITYCYDGAGNMTARVACPTGQSCEGQCP